MTNETAVIQRLDALISAVSRAPGIPPDRRLWDAETVAEYLSVSPETVRNRYAPRPDFPAAIRLPTEGSRGTARWKAEDIIDWANNYQERKRRA